MGQLVFQATLGGAVNLIGPNTASTINFTLPSADGTSGQALATNGTGTLAFSSFATLVSNTFTGSQTLSAGTASGVTYLNGSKVLTSGSALTFDGTNFAVVGGNATINRSTNTSRLTLGGSPSANWEGDIQFVTSNTQTNWRVSSNQVTSGAFTITPSTAGGGSTFTTPAVTIDNASNLGLGVTPSAWLSSIRALQVNNAGMSLFTYSASASVDQYAFLTNNSYQNSSVQDIYVRTNPAAQYRQFNGTHSFYTAPSGTAGNAITFTEVLKLQNVSQANATLQGTNATFLINATGGSTYPGLFIQVAGTPFAQFSGDGTNASVGANGYLAFGTNGYGTERGRFDTSGNFLVAATNSSMTTGTGIKLTAAGGGASTPTLGLVGNSSDNGQGSYHLYSSSLSQYQFYVTYGGTIYARSTSITGLSDISEKENIRDLETGLNSVLALQPRRFDWKNGSGTNVSGFIAQEVQSVLPDLVESYKISDEENKLGLKMGDMIPTLVKAIQELKAEFDAYKASHP